MENDQQKLIRLVREMIKAPSRETVSAARSQVSKTQNEETRDAPVDPALRVWARDVVGFCRDMVRAAEDFEKIVGGL